jgi:hypothetical protein
MDFSKHHPDLVNARFSGIIGGVAVCFKDEHIKKTGLAELLPLDKYIDPEIYYTKYQTALVVSPYFRVKMDSDYQKCSNWTFHLFEHPAVENTILYSRHVIFLLIALLTQMHLLAKRSPPLKHFARNVTSEHFYMFKLGGYGAAFRLSKHLMEGRLLCGKIINANNGSLICSNHGYITYHWKET